ncbi:hypothetical protein HDR58_04855 [bacterium]|nr:hypothetical protein [bacterium]
MLILFFTIIFIAELIIVSWIISKLNKFNTVICKTNEEITAIRPVIKDEIEKVRTDIYAVNKKMGEFSNFLDVRKNDYLNMFKPQIWSTIGKLILNADWKKFLIIIDIFLGIKKFLRK